MKRFYQVSLTNSENCTFDSYETFFLEAAINWASNRSNGDWYGIGIRCSDDDWEHDWYYGWRNITTNGKNTYYFQDEKIVGKKNLLTVLEETLGWSDDTQEN